MDDHCTPRRRQRRGPLALFFAAAALLSAGSAAAQSTSLLQRQPTVDTSSTAYQVQVSRPNENDDGLRITCIYGQSDCLVFNRELCTSQEQSTPIRLAIYRGNAPLSTATSASTIKAYAWLQRGNGVCSTDPTFTQDGNLVWPFNADPQNLGFARTHTLTTTSSVVSAAGTSPLLLPDDFGSGWPPASRAENGKGLLTAGDIMHAFPDVCDENGPGIAYARMRLCFGVDLVGLGTINVAAAAATSTSSGAPTSSTPTGYLEFLVSTAAPPAPIAAPPAALYERVRFDVTYDNSQQTLTQLRIDQLANPSAAEQADCGAWEEDVTDFGVPQDLGGQIGQGSATIEVPGVNGTPYAYCVYTIDVVGNLSTPAGPFLGSPQQQSGLFAVWDPPPHTGFGSCQGGSSSLPVWGLAWGLLRRRRRCYHLALFLQYRHRFRQKVTRWCR